MGNIFNTRSEFDKREAQERLEELNVSYGNAPVAKDSETSVPVAGPATIDASSLTNQTTSDNKCPSCGATLAFDPSTGGLICNFCGSTVALKTMPVAPGLGYSLDDLQNNAGRHLMQTESKLLICGTCGGQFLADKSSLSGLCPYCGSNSITESGNTSGMMEPTGVIPFKISKEEAQNIFKQWISARRMAPTDLKKNSEITKAAGIRVKIDDSDQSMGWKAAEYEMKGVPLRVEIGPKDMEKDQCCICRRDSGEKVFVPLAELETEAVRLLDEVHKGLYERAAKNLADHTYPAFSLEEAKQIQEEKGGFIKTMWCGELQCELDMKEKAGMTSRCIPFVQEHLADTCPICGKPAKHMIYWGVAY